LLIRYLQENLEFPSTWFYNTFFYNQLARKDDENPSEYGYQKVKKWTSKVDIFTKKFLIIPICESYLFFDIRMHWYLAIVYNPAALLNVIHQISDDEDELVADSQELSRGNSPIKNTADAIVIEDDFNLEYRTPTKQQECDTEHFKAKNLVDISLVEEENENELYQEKILFDSQNFATPSDKIQEVQDEIPSNSNHLNTSNNLSAAGQEGEDEISFTEKFVQQAKEDGFYASIEIGSPQKVVYRGKRQIKTRESPSRSQKKKPKTVKKYEQDFDKY
jgi:hypothetical protein